MVNNGSEAWGVCLSILQHSLVSEILSVATHRLCQDIWKLPLYGASKSHLARVTYTVTDHFDHSLITSWSLASSSAHSLPTLFLLGELFILPPRSFTLSFLFRTAMLEDSYVQITVRKLKQNKTTQNQSTYTVFLLKNKQSSIEKEKKKDSKMRYSMKDRTLWTKRHKYQRKRTIYGSPWVMTEQTQSTVIPQIQSLFLH